MLIGNEDLQIEEVRDIAYYIIYNIYANNFDFCFMCILHLVFSFESSKKYI